jgi:hypothetical protein
MSKIVIGIFVLAIALLIPSISYACGIEAWNFGFGMTPFTDGNWTFGEVFVPNQNLSVIFLGYATPFGLNTFMSPHPVGLFDASGNLLASTVIDNNSTWGDPYPPTIGGGGYLEHFAFNYIPLVQLVAGQTCVIEGVSNSDPYFLDVQAGGTFLPVSLLGSNQILDNGLNFNGAFLMDPGNIAYWGPNFGIGPEPSTLILMSGGIVGAASVLRRRIAGRR